MRFSTGASAGDSQCISISINDDDTLENNEVHNFRINTGDLQAIVQVNSSTPARITIIDNDSKF